MSSVAPTSSGPKLPSAHASFGRRKTVMPFQALPNPPANLTMSAITMTGSIIGNVCRATEKDKKILHGVFGVFVGKHIACLCLRFGLGTSARIHSTDYGNSYGNENTRVIILGRKVLTKLSTIDNNHQQRLH